MGLLIAAIRLFVAPISGVSALPFSGDMISLTATVRASADQISCDLAGESVVLSLKNSLYYALDPVGTRIWELLQEPRTVASIRDVILEEYDVEAGRCESDLINLLGDLDAQGLIEVSA
jgi:hypothetical protein